MEQKTTKETFKISGKDVMKKLKALIKEGNAHTIIVKNNNGKEIAEFNLTMGAVGAVIAPILAAVGAMAAILSSCTIIVEKTGSKPH